MGNSNVRVTCTFLGRLGNNLFSTAAVIGYAEKHGLQWAVPGGYHHRAIYDYFPNLPILKHSPARFPKYDEHPHGRDNWFDYYEIPFWPSGINLYGFFQSEKYFENSKETIQRVFKLPHVSGYENYVSIHVRRTDYVDHPGSFPPVNEDYLRAAMNEFDEDQKFLVCSDDIPWCRNFLGTTNIEYSCGTPWEDLCRQASCRDHIMSNSTFSWWSSYLGHNPDRQIITPAQSGNNWFGETWDNSSIHKPKTLIPDGWKQINFR